MNNLNVCLEMRDATTLFDHFVVVACVVINKTPQKVHSQRSAVLPLFSGENEAQSKYDAELQASAGDEWLGSENQASVSRVSCLELSEY